MAKKKVETINTTTDIQPLSNATSWSDFIQNNAYMQFPQKDDWRKRFIYTFIEWASKDDSLEIMDFYVEMKMYRTTVYDWANKYPDVKDALDYVRLMLAARRRKGALLRKYDKDMALRDMHMLDPEWLTINKYHSDMKTEEAKQSYAFIINDAKPKIVSKEEMMKQVEE